MKAEKQGRDDSIKLFGIQLHPHLYTYYYLVLFISLF